MSKRSQNRIKKQLFSQIFYFIELYLHSFGLKINKLELIESNEPNENVQTDKETIDRAYLDFRKKFSIDTLENENLNPDSHLMILQSARDEANMSAIGYCRFRNKINQILGSYKLKSIQKVNLFKFKLNRFFDIYNNDLGCYVNTKNKIDFTLKKIYEKLNGIIQDNTFNLHLSGDGMIVSKTNLNIITFVFRCLNENSSESNGLYTLGLFQVNTENYDQLKTALQEIINKLKEIKTFEFNNRTLLINWTQGGDLKWISNINGINAANADQPCPWCCWNAKTSIKNPNKRIKYSISDRNINNANASEYKKDGYKNPPLIEFIEFQKAVFDPLHMCLRITDKLFDKFISHLDAKDKDSSFNLDKRPNLKVLSDYLNNYCGITEALYFDQKDKKVALRSLNEKERLRILLMLQIKDLSNLYKDWKKDNYLIILNFVLIEFYKIYIYIKEDHSNNFDRTSLENRLNKWLESFILINETTKITPYIHILVDHVPEFIEKYKYLNQYSMQSVEKLNFVIKQNYFRQTNKRKNQYLKQLLEKQNRLEFIKLNGTLEELNEKLNSTNE